MSPPSRIKKIKAVDQENELSACALKVNEDVSKFFNSRGCVEMTENAIKLLQKLKNSSEHKDKELREGFKKTNNTYVNSLRSSIFNLLQAIFSRNKKQNVGNVPKIEELIRLVMDLQILSHNQILKTQTNYTRTCIKLGLQHDEFLFNKFKSSPDSKFYQILQQNNASPKSDVKIEINFNTTTTNTSNVIHTQNITQANPEEAKETNGNDKRTPKYEKEFCIICMEKSREVVFLPCRHFLTCDSCGGKFRCCPICEKKLDSQMKIFWS